MPLCLLLLSACGTKNNVPAEQPKAGIQENQKNEANDSETSLKTSLRSLLASNKAVSCTYEENTQDADSKIKFYLDPSTKKMRTEGNILDKKTSKNMKMWSVMDGNNNYYIWNDVMSGKGIKMSMDELQKKDVNNTDTNAKVDLDAEKEVKCRSWKVDNSFFELPKDVNFSDITAQVKQMQTQVPSGNKSMCDACNMIPDQASKDQCLKTGNCLK